MRNDQDSPEIIPSGAPPDIVRSGGLISGESHQDPSISNTLRDEFWLQQLLDETWDRHFAEVPQANIVRIEFGRRAKRQLGCIRRDRKEPDVTVIVMNGLFRSAAIPEFVVEATLVHELIHYAHGFNSPLEQQHAHPHAGGIIRAEYAERGLEALYVRQKRWLKAHWPAIVAANFAPAKPRQRTRRKAVRIAKPFWM